MITDDPRTLKKALKHAEEVRSLWYTNYPDTVFPNATLLNFPHLESLTIIGPMVRARKKAPEYPPTRLQIDTVALEHLPDLKYLWLSQFDLRSMPDGLFSLSNLEGLAFNYCVMDSIPSAIGELKNLKALLIGSTQIDSLPETITALPHLETLILWQCHFTSIPDQLERMPNLRRLRLDNPWHLGEGPKGTWNWPFPSCANHIDYEREIGKFRALLSREQLQHVAISLYRCDSKWSIKQAIVDTMLLKKIKWSKPQPCPEKPPDPVYVLFWGPPAPFQCGCP